MSATHRYNTRYQARKAAEANAPTNKLAEVTRLKALLDLYNTTVSGSEERVAHIINILITFMTCPVLLKDNPMLCKTTYERCISIGAEAKAKVEQTEPGMKKIRYYTLVGVCNSVRNICLKYM